VVAPLPGQAVLAGLAALDVPTCDPVVRGKPAHSIAFVRVSGKRVLGRAYDKGREAGTAEAWELIRLEDQKFPAVASTTPWPGTWNENSIPVSVITPALRSR
jgi:hypothetical protein